MKATWITSAVAGVIFGAVVHASERHGEKADVALILPVLFVLGFVGVVGIAQIREVHAERKKRGMGFFGVMIEREDFTRFYFPGWGRMFVWFAATVATIFSLKALLP